MIANKRQYFYYRQYIKCDDEFIKTRKRKQECINISSLPIVVALALVIASSSTIAGSVFAFEVKDDKIEIGEVEFKDDKIELPGCEFKDDKFECT